MEPSFIIEDIINKVVDFHRGVMKCALKDPFNFSECIDSEMKNSSPTLNAARMLGVSEFDLPLEDILIDGIVVDKEKALTTPCKCIVYDGKELCWSPGIVGMLTQEQIKTYCPTKIYENKPKLIEHLNKFKEVAKMTRGLPFTERIEEMKKLLKEEGEETESGEGALALVEGL